MGMTAQMETIVETVAASQTQEVTNKNKKSNVSGRTVGNPQVSEKAAKYYEQLKAKFSDKEFVLVSSDMKEQAKAHAASFANPNKMVVLIDDEKLERMAEDENYRKQYESIIANAGNKMSQLQSSVSQTGAKVKGYGMQINDNGTASYFAVIDKSLSDQKSRIEKKAEEKKEAKKADEKKARKEQQQERLEERMKERRAEKTQDSDTVTITANSIEELIQKIEDEMYLGRSDRVQTEQERQVGQNFDIRF